jgi:hypothetical protein
MRGKAGVKRHERPFGESAALYRKTGVGSNRPKIDTMNTLSETIRGYRFRLRDSENEPCETIACAGVTVWAMKHKLALRHRAARLNFVLSGLRHTPANTRSDAQQSADRRGALAGREERGHRAGGVDGEMVRHRAADQRIELVVGFRSRASYRLAVARPGQSARTRPPLTAPPNSIVAVPVP